MRHIFVYSVRPARARAIHTDPRIISPRLSFSKYAQPLPAPLNNCRIPHARPLLQPRPPPFYFHLVASDSHWVVALVVAVVLCCPDPQPGMQHTAVILMQMCILVNLRSP